MVAAVKIDGVHYHDGKRHIDILKEYQKREELTDDEIDAMIDEGRIEFGSVLLSKEGMKFSVDETRNSVYSSMDQIYWVAGKWNAF